MKCHICDATLTSPTYNRDHDDFDPCGKCLAVIAEVFPDDGSDDTVSDSEPDNWATEDGSDAYNTSWEQFRGDESTEDAPTGEEVRED